MDILTLLFLIKIITFLGGGAIITGFLLVACFEIRQAENHIEEIKGFSAQIISEKIKKLTIIHRRRNFKEKG